MDKVVTVITSYNRADFITTCLKSVLASSNDNLEVQALVMDNGSSDGSPELAAAFGEKVRVEHTPDNRPVIGVINRGLRIALDEMKPDYIILMNEDTEFRPGALSALVSSAEKHPNALLTPLQLNYRQPDQVDPIMLSLTEKAEGLLEDALMGRPLKSTYPVRMIIGACMFAHRQVWQRLGYWDELYLFYGPDYDYCNRALHLGYEVLMVPHAQMLHAHGSVNPEIRAVKNRDRHTTWRLHAQERYMFILKDPDTQMPRCLLQFFGRFVSDQFKYFFSLWPKCMLLSASAFWDCVLKLPKVAANRKDQFSNSRKAVNNPL